MVHQSRRMQKSQVLAFFFRLGFLTVGEGYECVSAGEERLVADMAEFGLLYCVVWFAASTYRVAHTSTAC